MDTRTPEQRSRIMRSVGTKNTGPEMAVRKAAHSFGYRFRIHRRDLPGTPDLVFPRLRKALFVHGCFWHGHDCPKGQLPKSRQGYWCEKIEANKRRDATKTAALEKDGWRVGTIWQCETRNPSELGYKLLTFLRSGNESDRHS